MSTGIKRHPLAIAWDGWLESKEGQSCKNAEPLCEAEHASVYLTNRLHRAFDAGASAKQQSVIEMIDGLIRTDEQLVLSPDGYNESLTELRDMLNAEPKEGESNG